MIERNRNPNGTADGIGVMADMTGLSRKSMLEIWADVKANHAKLDACEGHEFIADANERSRKFTCKNCGGEADQSSVRWYTKGLEHALKLLNDNRISTTP